MGFRERKQGVPFSIPAADILIGVVNFVNWCLVVVDLRFDLAAVCVVDGGDSEDLGRTWRRVQARFLFEKMGFF